METIAIVGRPNVGKSTLFNRITGERKSIVDDQSGVTRDRVYGESEWGGISFNVIDTGGFVLNSDDVFETAIREQVHIAMQEATLLLFVVDVTTGITVLDDEITTMLRRGKKKVIVVVNKVDNGQRLIDATEFYSLGFEDLYSVSSINGSGTGELMDAIIQDMEVAEVNNEISIPKIAIIGQPNAGKSSIINTFLGEDRNVVTDIPGTTRDTINSHYKKFDKDLILIDTAGLRKKAKVHENLEFYSVIRAINAMDEADVCILMIDAEKGITVQDINIFGLAQRKGKGIVVVVNKWDLVKKDTNTAKEYEALLKERVAPFNDVPVVFASVKEKQRVLKVLDIAMDVYNNRIKKITTSKLNDVMQKVIERYSPPVVKGKNVTIKYVMQLPTHTPTFAFYCNHPKYIKTPYKNYLENKLREHFDFTGVPINLFFREK